MHGRLQLKSHFSSLEHFTYSKSNSLVFQNLFGDWVIFLRMRGVGMERGSPYALVWHFSQKISAKKITINMLSRCMFKKIAKHIL